MTGYTFQSAGTPGEVPSNATTGQTMTYTGVFGPPGLEYFNPNASNAIDTSSVFGYTYAQEHVLGNLLVSNGGVLTVPLAQIVASGNISIPSQYAGGRGTFLILGDPGVLSSPGMGIYNVLGGPATTDPGAYLDYATNTIVPEPTTFVLAAMGLVGGLMYLRRRKVS